jgi:iron complex outermembrane recepter protein
MCVHQKPVRQSGNWLITAPKMLRLLCAGLGIALISLAGVAFADQPVRHYHIPAQALDSGLLRLAADSGLEILFTADKVRGVTTNGLDGSMTHAQALARLLQGSGMTYRFVDARTVTIEPGQGNFKKTAATPDNPEPQSNGGEGQIMPKVTVEADAEYDAEYYTDPYNKDYVLPNATAGTKTDTPVMETPLNVQVISKQLLKERQVFRLADALKNVSGVRTDDKLFGGASYTERLFLRGFDSQTFFRDGFRLQQGSASREFANVESVEVLKGSAAILYGLVEPGGMVNVITKKPLATPYYGFTQQVGSFDTYRSTLDATGPIAGNKDVLYRLNMSYENSGSFRDFVGKEDVFFAPKLTWNISPKTQVNFELEYNHAHLGIDNPAIPLINDKLLQIPSNRNYAEYSPTTSETVFGSFNWSHKFNDDWMLKHRFSANHASTISDENTFINAVGPQVTGIPGFDTPANLTSRIRLRSGRPAKNNTYATNLDVIGHFDTWNLQHTLLLGGDYYRLSDKTDNRYDSVFSELSFINTLNPAHPGTPFGFPVYNWTHNSITSGPAFVYLGFPSKQEISTDQFGLYIQDQIKLPYNVHVTGGIRWQYIHNRTDTTNYNPNLSFASATQEGSTQDAVTPRVGILWNPEKWLSLYANYTESFGANTAKSFIKPGIGKILDPTSAEQYEGGIKLEFFGGKLRGTFAYYDLTKTNIAAADPNRNHDCGGGPNTCSIPIGEVRSRGPEVDIQGEILPGWNVIGAWSNLDLRITKASPIDPNLGPQGGDFVSGRVGDRPNGQPRNSGTLWTTYEVQSGDFKGLQFGGGLNFQDRVWTGDARYPNPGFITADLMAGYSRKIGDATISAQLNINNLLDKYYTTNILLNGGGNNHFAAFGAPRTFMGQVSVQY